MKTCRTCVVLCVLAALSASCAQPPATSVETELSKEMAQAMGTFWYGVYFRGKQKCGFARTVITKERWLDQEAYSFSTAVCVVVNMAGTPQRIVVRDKKYYKLTGELLGVESSAPGLLGRTSVRGEVKGDKLLLTSTMGGRASKSELPAPNESLTTVLAPARLVKEGKIGGSVQLELFEPQLYKAVPVTSTLLRFEDRVLGGVKTRIAVIESTMHELGMKGLSYVTTDGEMLELVVSGLFTLRKEPKEMAKDVRTAFDAIRAGIISVKERLGDPQRVKMMKLRLTGVRKKELLIDDARQKYERGGDGEAASHVLTVRKGKAPERPHSLPMNAAQTNPELAQYLKPSPFVQSDAPEIIQTARKIVGDEKDSFKAALKIRAWVYHNVEKKFRGVLSNALGVLKKMEGDCSEHSVLFVALCRAAGIPARQVAGIGYWDEMKGFGYHAWGEVYVGEWVAVEPTWDEELADATHVKFGVGDMDSLVAIAGLFGSLQVEVLEVEREE